MKRNKGETAEDLEASLGTDDFRIFLQTEFVRRCRRSQHYNMSAFARLLGLDASTVAKILKGQRPVRRRAIQRLGMKLGLTPYEIQRFADASPRANSRRRQPVLVTGRFRTLSLDAFQLISDWYHYAILELMRLPSFRQEAGWIAKRLAITPTEAMIAVERLQRLGMIKVLPDGVWQDVSGKYTTTLGNDFTAEAFRNLQRQILNQAERALDEIPIEARSQTSMTMAINRRRLPDARKAIVEFQRTMNALLSDAPKSDLQDVYQLSIALFPATDFLKSGNSV